MPTPTLVQRNVTGTLRDAGGAVLSRKELVFTPAAVVGADGTVVPTGAIKALTAEAGTFEVELYTLDVVGAFTRYSVSLPDGNGGTVSATFDLAYDDGSDITLDELLNLEALGNADLTAAMAACQAIVDAAHARVLLSPTHFASLPTPTAGMLAYIDDSNTVVWGATIAGGGSNKVLAFYNGTNWTVAGK